MMEALNEAAPKLKLNALATPSQKDEQRGYRHLFVGGMVAIRNPRGHDHSLHDDLETCLGHLIFVTMLLKQLQRAGFKLTEPAR